MTTDPSDRDDPAALLSDLMTDQSSYGLHSLPRSLKPLDLARLLSKVEIVGGCWLWSGYRTKEGYGPFTVDQQAGFAHRFSFIYFVGPIPEGMELDHLCRKPACINPEHLEIVTSRENTLRGVSPPAINANATHCKNGHPFDETNTLICRRSGREGLIRVCRVCNREKCKQRRYRQKQADVPEATR